jgi:hypothetical protein
MPGTPLAFNYSGGSSRYAQNFFALKSLGIELHVIRFHIENQIQKILDFERSSQTAQTARQYAASWQDIVIPANQPDGKWEIFCRIFLDPIAFEFPCYKVMADQLARAVTEIVPDLIWAEYSDVAVAIWKLSPSQPWVYSSTDIRYLVRSIRNQKTNLHQQILHQISRKVEIKSSRSANFVVTGSITEAVKLRKIGCRSVYMIPMANTDFPEINPNFSPSRDIKIVHLGSLETTANRKGLAAYLSEAHPKTMQICAENRISIQLVVVGDASRTKPPLSDLLLQENILVAGYTPDLSSVLRPYDIAILPYTQDSGYRTKLPLLMGHAQVIVAMRAAVAGSLLPGLEDVCILLDQVEDFPQKISWLSTHPHERKRLGQAGCAFAKRHFSLDAVLPLYTDLLGRMT